MFSTSIAKRYLPIAIFVALSVLISPLGGKHSIQFLTYTTPILVQGGM